jgi:hypothetical protein
MADIFISYASEDRPRVEPLAKALEEQGWSVFWDRIIPIGKTWDDVIEEEIDAAKCIIVIWSDISVASGWVRSEAEEGLRRNILIPVQIDHAKIPLRFRSIQAADLTEWDGKTDHSGFTILFDAISGIAGPSPFKVKEEEERAQKKEYAEVKPKAEEEIRIAYEERQVENGRTFEQSLDRKADSLSIETEKPDVKQLDTEKKEDKLIAVVDARQLWPPILITSIGWAIGGYVDRSYGGNMGLLAGAIGGFVTVIALRRIVPNIQVREIFLITISWAIALLISALLWEYVGDQIFYYKYKDIDIDLAYRASGIVGIIGRAIGGAIGGFVTVIALRQRVKNIWPKKVLSITIGWALSCATGLVIADAIIGIRVIGHAIGGFLGGVAMFLLLRQAIQRD